MKTIEKDYNIVDGIDGKCHVDDELIGILNNVVANAEVVKMYTGYIDMALDKEEYYYHIDTIRITADKYEGNDKILHGVPFTLDFGLRKIYHVMIVQHDEEDNSMFTNIKASGFGTENVKIDAEEMFKEG